MRSICVIPARFGSQRLPGKPLVEICGKPLIQHVWERVRMAHRVNAVLVATDDQRIADVVHAFGGQAVMTSPDCASGSDRVGEVIAERDEQIVINVQGDEPLIDPRAIERLIEEFKLDPNLEMATLARPLEIRDVANPNAVKVVCDNDDFALYFSRSPIPYWRDAGKPGQKMPEYWHHVGVYAYRREVLLNFLSLPEGRLEKAEKLEQLRALENGIWIKVLKGNWPCLGVDTPEDIKKVEALLAKETDGD